jgi:type IV secretory pathway VirB10-like protein
MDEVIQTKKLQTKVWEKMQGLVVIEPVSFSSKRRINFRGLAYLGCCLFGLFCLGVFVTPQPEEQTRTYSEHKTEGSQTVGGNQPQNGQQPDPLSQAAVHSSISGQGSGGSVSVNRNTSMVIPRDGDSSTTLPPGTKFLVKLTQAATVTGKSLPVIGVIVSAVGNNSSVAIPEGAQIFGDAVLDSDSERASITWKSILFPDGRSKNLQAIALGADNQAGVEGEFHSDALKNTGGQMVSRFVGGFAQGSISRGPLGANDGGVQNGLMQGLADTAKDRTDAWSQDLKKPREWLELAIDQKFQSILSQPFVFRDPGGVN